MTRHELSADVRAFEAELRALGNRAPAIMARSLNRAGLAGQTAMVRLVTADTGIAAKNVKREIVLDRANRTKPRFVLTIKGSRIPLIAFQARGPEPSRGRGHGVSYRLPTGRGRVPNAFIATMPSGHRGVFKRTAQTRTPITELKGPSLPHVFEKYVPQFRTAAEAALLTNLRHEIDFANRPTGPDPEGA